MSRSRSKSRSRSRSSPRRSRSPIRRDARSRSKSSKSSSSERGREHIVTLHGLPYSCTESEIINFLDGCVIVGDKLGVHMVLLSDGKASGDCFVELESEEDVKLALAKHRKNLGRRYVEVFRATRNDLTKAMDPKHDEQIVRLRGLPFECTKEEIATFFLGLPIAPNGITILTDGQGRTKGEGFVKFTDSQMVEKALEKHKEKIRHRYIEVFESSEDELQNRMRRFGGFSGGRSFRPEPFGRPFERSGRFGGGFGFGNDRFGGRFGGDRFGGDRRGRGFMSGRGGGRNIEYVSHTGYYVHMRGLPYESTEDDVAKFFQPITPVNIYIDFDRSGKATGEANVDFDSSADARDAMKKNRNMMRHRYIELYLNSSGPRASRF